MMRDVSAKFKNLRIATARASVTMTRETITMIRERRVPKGDVLEVSKVAATQAAKNTALLLPYCHPVAIDFVGVEYAVGEDRIDVDVTVKAIDRTGVEMEALTAAAAAALNLYDMLKMVDETLAIGEVRLIEKRGGKSDFKSSFVKAPRAAVLVMSDSVAAGDKSDSAGREIAERLKAADVEVADYRVIPDDVDKIVEAIKRYCDEDKLDVVLTSGGTGLSPRDNTPEAMGRVIEHEAPGIVEALRAHGQLRTPYSMLSRGRAGLRGRTLVINLPGSRRGAAESLDALMVPLLHGLKVMRAMGRSHGE